MAIKYSKSRFYAAWQHNNVVYKNALGKKFKDSCLLNVVTIPSIAVTTVHYLQIVKSLSTCSPLSTLMLTLLAVLSPSCCLS